MNKNFLIITKERERTFFDMWEHSNEVHYTEDSFFISNKKYIITIPVNEDNEILIKDKEIEKLIYNKMKKENELLDYEIAEILI